MALVRPAHFRAQSADPSQWELTFLRRYGKFELAESKAQAMVKRAGGGVIIESIHAPDLGQVDKLGWFREFLRALSRFFRR